MSAHRILERKYVPRVGLFAHRKRYASWVQNVVRQFGLYLVQAFEYCENLSIVREDLDDEVPDVSVLSPMGLLSS